MEAHSIFIFVRFLADGVLTFSTAWLVARATSNDQQSLLEITLTWIWTFVALIAGAGVILGEIGGLGANGFLVIHAVVFIALIIWRRSHRASDISALKTFSAKVREFFNTPNPERNLSMLALAVLATLTVIAAWAEPVIFDAHAYHLPRIAQWLQDGRILMLSAQDERLNFVTGLPDLVMAWSFTATTESFHFANLTQSLGGIMSFGATVGLARQTGMSRSAALMAGCLLFGMANVVVQFTATQTDLFTTGVFATTFYLWVCSLQRGSSPLLPSLGIGLALAAKGTLFYLVPGAAIWVAWLAWCHPASWRYWYTTAFAGAVGILFFAGPGFNHNWRNYGSALGPAKWVEKVHRHAESRQEFLLKLRLNLEATFAQNFDPNSQPLPLRSLAYSAGYSLAQSLPDGDKFTLDGLSRRKVIQVNILKRRTPDADITAFGIVTLVLFVGGSLIALLRLGRDKSGLVLVWSGGVVCFLLFFEAMQQWHSFAFRYFVLIAPWIAIVSAWGIEQLGRLRVTVWILALLAAANVGWTVTAHTSQAGWSAAARPERSFGYFIEESWRQWSQRLDCTNKAFTVALPEERPLAAFYRQQPTRNVNLRLEASEKIATAEDFASADGGWTIVPAARFMGKEGNVATSVWLHLGDENNFSSIAAYRRLKPGEQPSPVIYRHRMKKETAVISNDLMVKTWNASPVLFELNNPTTTTYDCRVVTPLGTTEKRVAAGEKVRITVELPAGVVSPMTCFFSPPQSVDLSSDFPFIELIR